MKTFRNWTATAMSLTSFLKPGDEVDQEMADYFINAVPPKTMTTDLILHGEPHDHFSGIKTGNTVRSLPR